MHIRSRDRVQDETDMPSKNPTPVLSPNIAFVGEKPWKPLESVTAQGVTFDLPKDQSKPFHHEQASYIIRHFGHLYKPVTEKGK
jgi:hypothetical protein